MKKINFYIIILLLIVILKIFFIQFRYINPDEGNHLYAGKLVNDGLVPNVDFESRGIIYTYTISFFVSLFGSNLLILRLFPLLCNVLSGILLYFIILRIYNKKIALLSTLVFLLSPCSLLWSSTIKTEPYSTFFVLLSIYFFIIGEKNIRLKFFNLNFKVNQYNLFLLSGIFFGFAYLVRESVMYLGLFYLLYLGINYKKYNIKILAILFVGFFFILSTFFISFILNHGFNKFLNSNLNPLQKILSTGISLGNDQSIIRAIHELMWGIYFNSFFIFSIGILFLINIKNKNFFKKNSLFIMWLISISIFYCLYFIKRGFFNQYFYEFLPVFSLFFGLLYFNKKKFLFFTPKVIRITMIMLFLSSFVLFSPKFGSVWSMESLKNVETYLDEDSVVMSGSLIWQFESGSKTYLNLTNTLGFRGGMGKEYRDLIESNLISNPPTHIILDGYTEQNYLKQIPYIETLIINDYKLIYIDYNSKLPIKIYKKKI
jgi:hypothetical protein